MRLLVRTMPGGSGCAGSSGWRWALFVDTNVEWFGEQDEDTFQAALAKTREYLKAKESGGPTGDAAG